MTETLQALLTPLIALITAYVAYQQYRIRRDEKALELYDRRLAVFKTAISALHRIQKGDLMTVEDVHLWWASLAEARFLFGEEVQVVLESFFSAVHAYAFELEVPTQGGEPGMSVKSAEAVLEVESHYHPLIQVFTPYLRPAGSPNRRKRRLTVKEASELLSRAPKSAIGDDDWDDIQF